MRANKVLRQTRAGTYQILLSNRNFWEKPWHNCLLFCIGYYIYGECMQVPRESLTGTLTTHEPYYTQLIAPVMERATAQKYRFGSCLGTCLI